MSGKEWSFAFSLLRSFFLYVPQDFIAASVVMTQYPSQLSRSYSALQRKPLALRSIRMRRVILVRRFGEMMNYDTNRNIQSGESLRFQAPLGKVCAACASALLVVKQRALEQFLVIAK